MHRDFWS